MSTRSVSGVDRCRLALWEAPVAGAAAHARVLSVGLMRIPCSACVYHMGRSSALVRATGPLFRASAFASRSFSVFILIFAAFAPSGNKRWESARLLWKEDEGRDR